MTTLKTKFTLAASGLIMLTMAAFAIFGAQRTYAAGLTNPVSGDLAVSLFAEDGEFPDYNDCFPLDDAMVGVPTEVGIIDGTDMTDADIIASEKAFLQSLVDDGSLTQAEADRALADLEKMLEDPSGALMLDGPCGQPFPDADCFGPGFVSEAVPFGADDGAFEMIFTDGESEEEIIAALKEEEKKYLQSLVDAGTITQAEADEMLADFDVMFADGPMMEEGSIADDGFGMVFEDDASEEEIIASLKEEEKKYLQGLVDDGTITQAEADEMLADFDVVFEDMTDGFMDVMPCGEDPYMEALSTVLGLDLDELYEALAGGTSIADIAKAEGVAVQKVIDALVAAETEMIDEMLKDGFITQADADEWRKNLVKQVTFDVTVSYPDPYQIAADLLKIDVEALWAAMDDGKSIADLAEDKGVSKQAIIDAIVKADNDLIDAQVEADLISETEAKIWRAETATYAADLVNNNFSMWFEELPAGMLED